MTREEIAEIKRSAYETLARVEETLAEPRPEYVANLQPPIRYRGYHEEIQLRDALEARINKRLDAIVRPSECYRSANEKPAEHPGSPAADACGCDGRACR
jgi:hypothetical protein